MARSAGGDSRKDETAGDSETSTAQVLRLEVYGALLTLFSLALLLALATFHPGDVQPGAADTTVNFLGPLGAYMAGMFLYVLGLVAFPFALVLGLVGVRAVFRRPVHLGPRNVIWTLVALVMLSVLLEIALPGIEPFGFPIAGWLGNRVGRLMEFPLRWTGTLLIASVTLVIAVTYLSGQSIGALLRGVGRALAAGARLAWQGARSGAAGLVRRLAMRAPPPLPPGPEASLPDTKPGRTCSQGEADVPDTRVDGPRIHEGPDRFGRPTLEGALPANGEDSAFPDVERAPMDLEILVHEAPVPEAAPGPRTESTRSPRIVVTPQKPPAVQESLALPRVPTDPYVPPPMTLLDAVQAHDAVIDKDLLRRNAETLTRKLLDYKVEGKVVEIHPGPVVTMYEFLPAPGVKISQIANLADDLTMALEAVSIRIVAPIPGKGVVGIEVPNALRETVFLREILASEAFSRSKSKLTLALGKDIFGTPMVTDLSKMPHLLIAGATGSGKSVAVNAFILSLLYNASPEEVRLILVDPKVVELQIYEGIPHLLLPVVYDPKHAAAALRWAVEEMERRYELLARFGCRNLQSFNQRVDRLLARDGAPVGADDGDTEVSTPIASATDMEPDPDELKKLPYIVIVLDEFADLMMVASKDVETAVARLAQKARAAGIHLVMATQRPSKEVITGLIKANFPSRIAFRVSSKIDSRIILDQSGADALLGYGDMLFLRPGSSLVTRVHGPFVADEEVGRVTAHLKAQGAPEYQMEILAAAADSEADEDPDDLDPLLDEAQDIVLESRRASISFLQRKLKIGYNRSARIMEQLERRAVVGPPDSRGERQVLI